MKPLAVYESDKDKIVAFESYDYEYQAEEAKAQLEGQFPYYRFVIHTTYSDRINKKGLRYYIIGNKVKGL